MCGIAGYIASEAQDGYGMTRLLAHRGPDSMGEHTSLIAGKFVYMGHTRLSIVDLSDAGRQPMETPDSDVIIVYNGEIYNHLELKQKYLKDYHFTSTTDTEVILYLYKELGLDFVHELNGDFSIALLDRRSNHLYLVRDRLGIKPLYFTHQYGSFAFASEIKSLHALFPESSLSEQSIQSYFVFKYVPGNDTLFTNIKRLPPGSIGSYDIAEDRWTVCKYWVPEIGGTPQVGAYQDLTRELHDVLESAVKLRLIADVPVGTFLSGGLDSSAIAYFIRNHPEIIHYCARKDEKDLRKEGTTSDSFYAEQMAEQWGLDLRFIDIGGVQATREFISKTLYYSDDLIADGSQIPSYMIARQARETSKVMLSGMGADEIFLGYASHMLSLLALYFDRLPGWLSQPLASRMKRIKQGRGSFKAYRRWLHKFGKYYLMGSSRYGAYSIVGDIENSMRVCRQSSDSIIDYLNGYFKSNEDPFDCLTRFELDNFLVKNLHYFDRMLMANGVEGRVPFMDHRVVEFALKLPRKYKMSGSGIPKLILKDTMKGLLPDGIIKRRKAGFGMPLRSIFSSSEKVRELLDLEFFYGFDFFDVDHIESLINTHLNGNEDNSAILYALVSFQEWYNLYQTSDAQYAAISSES